MSTPQPLSAPAPSPRRRSRTRAEAQPQAKRAQLRRPQEGEVRVRLRGLGAMAVGTVEAMGAHAVGFARGDRVVFPLGRDERALLERPADPSADPDALLVNADRLLGVPRDVSDEQAARLLAPGLAARVLLRQLRPVKTGDRVRVELEPGVARSVLEAWAASIGALVVDDEDEPADICLDGAALRQAYGIAFRRGHLQAASADVFAAIRHGVFDDVIPAPDSGRGRSVAA